MRLVTWNVLADAYIRAEYYPHADARWLEPGARLAPLLTAIEDEPADVFCLQEVERGVVAAARAQLRSWTVCYEPKRGKPDGCAVLARPGVSVDEVSAIAFADGAPDRADSGHVALLATLRIGTLAVRLATTHLRWDRPGTPRDDRWAVREARELLAALRGPAIICGDLNVEPGDEAYCMLLDAGFVDPITGTNPATANPNGRAKRIDYVLHTRELTATVVAPPLVRDDTPLPSATMPSDHVPLIVELTG